MEFGDVYSVHYVYIDLEMFNCVILRLYRLYVTNIVFTSFVTDLIESNNFLKHVILLMPSLSMVINIYLNSILVETFN